MTYAASSTGSPSAERGVHSATALPLNGTRGTDYLADLHSEPGADSWGGHLTSLDEETV